MQISTPELFNEQLIVLCAVTARVPPVILRSSHREEPTFLSLSPRETLVQPGPGVHLTVLQSAVAGGRLASTKVSSDK